MSQTFDLCIIGHTTKDVITIDGQVQQQMVGGVPYYMGVALANLGANVGVLTKVAEEDRDLLYTFREQQKMTVFCLDSPQTTSFENVYNSHQADERVQFVQAIASPFTLADLQKHPTKAQYLHLAPLTSCDFEPSLFQSLAKQSQSLLSIDVQGLLRNIVNGKVILRDYAFKKAVLPYIHTLKADATEAQILTSTNSPRKAAKQFADYGIKEVIITFGSKGSLLLVNGQFYEVPAYPAPKIVDATGCGDTYLAAYLHQRLQGVIPEQSAHFAAQIAAKKLAYFGAYHP